MKNKDGLIIWEYNTVTGELKEAVYKQEGIFISNSNEEVETSYSYSLVTNNGCDYFTALNRKNAIKKIKKLNPDVILSL